MVSVTIKHNNCEYTGTAICHEEDRDLFSEKVGKSVALSRARISALKDASKNASKIAEIKYQLYQEVTEYGHKTPAEIDPTGALLRNATRSQFRAKALKRALKEEESFLKDYLRSQSLVVETIRKMRNKDKDN